MKKNEKNKFIDFYAKIPDNIAMKTVQHTVRWEGWLSNAVDEWRKKNGGKTFSQAVNYLIAIELERWGYTREHYEPGILETPKDEKPIRNTVKIQGNVGGKGNTIAAALDISGSRITKTIPNPATGLGKKGPIEKERELAAQKAAEDSQNIVAEIKPS
jgi:hypothetical protein